MVPRTQLKCCPAQYMGRQLIAWWDDRALVRGISHVRHAGLPYIVLPVCEGVRGISQNKYVLMNWMQIRNAWYSSTAAAVVLYIAYILL